MKLITMALLALLFLGADYPTRPNITNFQIKRIEFNENYFLGNDGFYFLEPRNEIDEVVSTELQRILDKLNKIKRPEPKTGPPDQGFPIPIPGEPTPQPEEEARVEWIKSPVSLDKDVYNLFNRRCASCHSGNKPKGNLALVNPDREWLLNLTLEQKRNNLRLVTGTDLIEGENRMPKGGTPLSNEDIQLLERWAAKKD